MRAIAANDRTVSAIRKADALPTIIPGGGQRMGNIPGEAAVSSATFTPFQVIKKTDTSVTILGATTQTIKDYLFIANTAPLEFTEADLTSITTSRWIYLSVTYSSGYAVAGGSNATFPTNDNTHYYHCLAYVTCVDSKITDIKQIHYGQIHLPGKIF